ncbi:hypothetical protein H5410_005348 [Solanum commersonii]|uniref:Uncharacterized protein n=1 Tax=Solanum commersonii TaxID=4109 RepID=A0A9J6A709_SOLCO|nr:hypothetical protein H5410_005348 [Solanum commersonii]
MMSISTNNIKLIELLNEKMGAGGENIQMDIFLNIHAHFKLASLCMHATHNIHESFDAGPNEHGYRSFDECSSSQRYIESSEIK